MMQRLVRQVALAGAATIVCAPVAGAQRLLDNFVGSTGISSEGWNFGAFGAFGIKSASQVTIPVSALVPISQMWSVDAYTAYASGTVKPVNGAAETISGMTDTRIRAVAHLRGDNLLLTLGATIPTGKTATDATSAGSAAVLAAPALRFRTPVLGGGAGGTTGLIYAMQTGAWTVGFAGAFEMRGSYTAAAEAGAPTADLNPGHAAHFSFAADRLSGEARNSLSLTADVYTAGQLSGAAVGGTSSFQLGPTFTGTYQRMLGRRDMQSTMYVIERYRSAYSRDGVQANGSARSETEAGVVAGVPAGTWATVHVGLEGRYHTRSIPDGLADDDPLRFAGAGMIGAQATAGVQLRFKQGAYVLEPSFRAQAGRVDGGTQTQMASGGAVGLTFTARF